MEKNIFHAFCVVFIYIFLSTNSMEEDENLKQILTDFKIDSSNIDAIEELLPKEIKEINKKNKQLNISFEYNEDNLKNIFNYLKNNYKEFYIELLEKMLYVPFFLVSELPTEYTYNLYLFDDFQKIKKYSSFIELKKKMFDIELFNKNLSEYFQKEIYLGEKFINNGYDLVKNNIKPLCELLRLILNDKVEKINNVLQNFKNIETNPFFKENIYEKEIKILEGFLKNCENKTDFDLFNEFIYTVFACYSMVNQDSINFDQKVVPFQYDCTLGYINQTNCMSIMDSIKNDLRFKGLKLNNNMFGPAGYYLLARNLLLNPSIDNIQLFQNQFSTMCLYFFVEGFEIKERDKKKKDKSKKDKKSKKSKDRNKNDEYYKLDKITEINLCNNFLDTDCGLCLSKLLDIFPNLLTLNLNKNNLGSSAKYLCVNLKNKYRTDKNYNFESLFFVLSNLDINSIIGLDDLISDEKCRLKHLNLNYNNLNNYAGDNLLKHLKYNKSLLDIYLYGCNIGNSKINLLNDIMRYSSLNWLYLYKNQINNFENLIRLFSNTKLINLSKINIEKEQQKKTEDLVLPCLNNLDISFNLPDNIDRNDLNIILSLIKKSGLDMFDMNNIVNGPEPDYNKPNEDIKDETDEINKLLVDIQDDFKMLY